jgi:hypothetical protein
MYLHWSVFVNKSVLIAVLTGGLAAEKKCKNKFENGEEVGVVLPKKREGGVMGGA